MSRLTDSAFQLLRFSFDCIAEGIIDPFCAFLTLAAWMYVMIPLCIRHFTPVPWRYFLDLPSTSRHRDTLLCHFFQPR